MREELSYLKENKVIEYVHDTIYVDKPFTVSKPYSKKQDPVLVVGYKDNPDIPKPSNDTVYSINIDEKSLEVSLFKDSSYHKELFDLDLTKYKYNYQDGILTKKLNWKNLIRPYVDLRVRPITRMYDLSAGVQFKTNHFNYKAGIGLNYYPTLKSGIGTDLELSISYTY